VRKRETDPIEAERQALADQRAALAELQQQLAARVAAVQARETELREAIARARNGGIPQQLPGVEPQLRPPSPLPAADAEGAGAAVRQRLAELEQREEALLRKVAELTEREKQLNAELATARDAASVELPPVAPDAERLETIAARMNELRVAEEAFARTREELAARSEAVSARERLVAERERELSDREDGWGNSDLHELESRLRRLEQQKTAAPASAGFSSGMRKLEQQGKRGSRPAS